MEGVNNSTLKPIVFKTSLGFIYFDYNDIIMCSADRNCTSIFTLESDSPIKILHKISFVDGKYCNKTFLRCHKSHIINLMHIEKLIIKTHQVQMKKGFIVPLSIRFWRKIRQISEMNIR